MGTSKELYGLLELPRGASREDVRKAHRRLVRKYHPDANSGDNSTEERFKEVQHAYEVLSDPRKRREYDEVLSDPRKRREYDEVLLRGSSRGEALLDLVRHVNSWKACVRMLAFFLIINSFLFYRSEQPKNTVSEPLTTASASQSIATSAEVGAGRRAETQAKENDSHPNANDHEQQDSSSYLRGTEPVATEVPSPYTEELSPYPLSSTAWANDPTPVTAEEGLTILPTSATAADYYSPDSLYEYSYYVPEPLYEEEVGYE